MYQVPSYEDTLEEIVNSGLHTMVLALGYRVGILDAMERLGKASTSREISEEAHLNPRYVEEWLKCTSSKYIVLYDNGKYSVRTSDRVRKAVHTSAALLIFADCFPKLVNAMKNVETKTGYVYPPHELEWLGKFSELSSCNPSWITHNLNPAVLHCHQQMNNMATSLQILDFGCGYGKLASELAKYYPKSSIYGTDIDDEAIQSCKNKYHLPNCQFEVISTELEKQWTEKFDTIIMMEVLHDLPNPVTVLAQVKRMLKADGYIIAFDPYVSADMSKNVGMKAAQNDLPYSMFFCLPNSLSQQPAAGHGGSWGYEDRERFITDHGFTIVKHPDDDNQQDPSRTHHHRIIFKK
uniref:Uncharacterized protein LOC111104708 n=1 Tax=Crassostrea virginica TaxID=6565 RepID=A0A8B8ATT0_CRAVI|nr:uncharacterized protein LOC111104708 [Crassostrea virginica]